VDARQSTSLCRNGRVGKLTLDFGLAKVAAGKTGAASATPGPDGATLTMGLTQAGTILGTAAYISPEQAKGEEADARSDVFSFGLVLYEMLSGLRAFSKKTAIETMAAIVRDEPAPLPATLRTPELDRVIRRCLRKAPAERFQSMAEVKGALEQVSLRTLEEQPSIAVLPFANMSADKENEYFSDGLPRASERVRAIIPRSLVPSPWRTVRRRYLVRHHDFGARHRPRCHTRIFDLNRCLLRDAPTFVLARRLATISLVSPTVRIKIAHRVVTDGPRKRDRISVWPREG
jgi:serine/threonine protein kinase